MQRHSLLPFAHGVRTQVFSLSYAPWAIVILPGTQKWLIIGYGATYTMDLYQWNDATSTLTPLYYQSSQLFGVPLYANNMAADPNSSNVYMSTTTAVYLLAPNPLAPPPASPPPPEPPGVTASASGVLTSCGASSMYSPSYAPTMAFDNNMATEWATASVGTGSWLCVSLSPPSGQQVTALTFTQRQSTNINDLIMTASLNFSDGTQATLEFGNYAYTTVASAHTPVTVPVTGTPTSVNITVTRTIGLTLTGNVGFAEITASTGPLPPPPPTPPSPPPPQVRIRSSTRVR